MSRRNASARYPLCVILISLVVTSLSANQQALFVEPRSIVMDVGAVGAKLTVSYSTIPVGLQTAGAGISVFFDSTKLQLESLIPIYQEGLLQATRTAGSVIVDSTDLDGDHLTDKRAIVAYTSFSGKWPDPDPLGPLELFSVEFVAKNENWTGETHVNFGVTSLASGFSSMNRSVTIRIQSESP